MAITSSRPLRSKTLPGLSPNSTRTKMENSLRTNYVQTAHRHATEKAVAVDSVDDLVKVGVVVKAVVPATLTSSSIES